MSDNYSKNAMGVVFSLPLWQGVVTDKKLSADVQAQHNIKKGMAKVRKALFDRKTNPEYAELRNAQSTARSIHLSMTVPTAIDGMRALPTKNYIEYKAKIEAAMQNVRDKAVIFQGVYPRVVKQAEAELGPAAFNLGDYPPQSEVAGRFEPKLQIVPLPVADDFVAEGNGVDQEAIREEIASQFRASVGDMVKDLYTRLHGTLKDVQKQLAQANCRLSDRSTASMKRVFETVQSLDPATWAKEEAKDASLGTLTTKLSNGVDQWDTKAINKGGQAKTLAQQQIATALAEINRKLSSLNAKTQPVEENTMPQAKTDQELFQEFLAWKQSQSASTPAPLPTPEDDDLEIEEEDEEDVEIEDDEDDEVEIEDEEETVYTPQPAAMAASATEEPRLSIDDVLKALGLKQ